MKYYLYLDEMLENLPRDVDYFALAGFAVSEIERDILDAKFNQLKNKHNITTVLHWTEFRKFSSIWKNKNEKEIKLFLNDFHTLLEEGNITIFSSMYNVRLIKNNIKSKKWHTHGHTYAMKKIFENFFLFLNKENNRDEVDVEGYIVMESSSLDEELKRLFHTIMIVGTDFVSAQGLRKLIKNIEFVSKSANNNLLQIADPMPSELHRLLKDSENFYGKLEGYRKEFQRIRNIIYEKQFKGYDNRGDLFGINVFE